MERNHFFNRFLQIPHHWTTTKRGMTWGVFFTELQWKQQRWFLCQSWGRCIKKLAAEWSHRYICNIVFILVFLRLVITGVIFKAGIKSYRSIFFFAFPVCVRPRAVCVCAPWVPHKWVTSGELWHCSSGVDWAQSCLRSTAKPRWLGALTQLGHARRAAIFNGM